MAQIEIDLLLESKQALDAIKGFSAQANKELASIKTSNLITSFTAIAATAIYAGKQILSALEAPIKAAQEQEDAINSLNAALQQNGNFTAQISKDLQDYASQLQTVTKIGDELTLSNLALLQSLAPLSKQGLIAANNAAVNLSAALKIDLESAIRLVGKAANGNVEAFKKYGVEIKKGSTDSESFANALDTLEKKFGGAATKEINTFSGALAQSANAFSDILEEAGAFIIQNDTVISAVKESTSVFAEYAETLKRAREGNLQQTSVLQELHRQQNENAVAFNVLNATYLQNAGLVDDLSLANEELARQQKLVNDGLKEVFGSSKNIDPFVEALENASFAAKDLKNNLFLKEQFKDFLPDLKKLEETLKNAGVNGIEAARKLRSERISLINDAVKAEQLGIKESASLRKKIEIDFQKSRLEFEKKLADEQQKAIQRQVDDASALVNLFEGKGRGAGQQGNASNVSGGDAIIIGSAVAAQNLLKGSEGAVNILKAGVGTAATAILGPIGQVVGPIISEVIGVLAQGPEKVRELITSFIQAIPTIIENILLAIPEAVIAQLELLAPLIEKLFEVVPRAIENFISRLPEVIQALIQGVLRAGAELTAKMPFVATQLATSLIAESPKIAVSVIDAFIKEAPRFITELVKQIPKAAGGAIGGIGDIGGGLLGGVGDVFGGIGDVFGFAEGGRVPDSSKFLGDKFPARLNAGEQVLDRDLSKQLETFLDGRGQSSGPQTMVVNLQVGQKELASVMLDLTRSGFRVGT